MGKLEKADADKLGLVEKPAYNGQDTDWVLMPRPEGVEEFRRGDHRLRVLVEDHFHVSWALLEWAGGPSVDVHGKEVEPAHYQVVAHGYGPSGSLREPRHTYFGDEGYVFYVQPALLAWGFEQLKRWFDFDGEEA